MTTTLLIHSKTDRLISWCGLFIANLVVPVSIGLLNTTKEGRYGMMAGIAMCWLIGTIICYGSALLGTALRWGALFVGFNQFIPVLQNFACNYGDMIAQEWKSQPQHNYQYLDNFTSGFVATMVTGGILMFVALIAGLFVLGCSYLSSPESDRKRTAGTP